MSQSNGKTTDTTSTVEVAKTNKRVWAQIMEKTDLVLRKIKNKKARMTEKNTGT